MTSFERIGLTIAGQFVDRRAVGPVLSLYGCRLSGSTPEAYYRDPGLYLAGQKAVVKEFDPDIVFAPFALALEAEAYGATLNWVPFGPPNVRKPIPQAVGDVANLEQIYLKVKHSHSYLVESATLLANEFKGDRPVAAIMTAPSDLPAILLGIDRWLDLLLSDQEIALDYLHFAEEHFVALGSALFEAGVTFVAVPVEFANPVILTECHIRELTLPSLARSFGRLPCPVVFHHGANPLAGSSGCL